MSDTEAPERFVHAPEGMAWVEGYDHWTGYWEREESARDEPDQSRIRYAEPDPNGFTGAVVRVPADEPASKADLMHVAAAVECLERRWQTLTTRLTGAAAILNMRNDPDDG